MAWYDGALGVLGLKSSRDNKQGQQQTNDLKQGLTDASGMYTRGSNDLNQQSSQLAGQNYYGGAQQAYQQQQANYGQQQNAASMLYNQATGAAPSAADMQMQQGLAYANNQAQSAMLSQQGGISPGLSQRNMLNAQAMQNASIVGQGAAMRAQETAAGQQAYSGALGQMANTANSMYGNQMALGQAQYGQGQNDLRYRTDTLQNQQMVQAGATQNIFNAQQGNSAAETAARQAQTAALGNTISSAASFFAGGSKGGGK